MARQKHTVALLTKLSLSAVFIILLSPWIFLLLPQKLSDHAYREIGYKIISKNITRGLESNQKRAIHLMEYLHENLFIYINPDIHSGRPFDQLRDGAAYCDYLSNNLGALLAKIGIRGRYVFLLDKNGVSPHTISEVFLDGEWRFFDPLYGLYSIKSREGTLATLHDISQDPSLLFENPRAKLFKYYAPEEFKDWKENYKRMIPMPREPTVISKLKYNRQHFFDQILNLYVDIFGTNFYASYLNLYLWRKNINFTGDLDEWLFFKARSYHLYGLKEKAEREYLKFEKNYADSKLAPRALFYRSLLSWFDFKDSKKTIRLLDKLITSYDNQSINLVAYNFLGKAYEKLGMLDLAMLNYKKASKNLMLDTIDRMYELETVN